MGGAKGLTHLQEILRGICFKTPWKYAVFWRLHVNENDRAVLTWEEAHYANYGPVDPSDEEHYLPDPIGKAVMEMSHVIHSLGKGIIGQVASTGKHQWVFADKKSLSSISSFHDCYDEWKSQFSAGIRTIAIVSVFPHGVVQLGSPCMITEDVKLVYHIKDVFHSVQDSSTESIPQNLFQYPVQSRLWSQVSPQQTGSETFSDIPRSWNNATSSMPHFLPSPSSHFEMCNNLSFDALPLDGLHQSKACGVFDEQFIFETKKCAKDSNWDDAYTDSNHNDASASNIFPVDDMYPYHFIWKFDEKLDICCNSAVTGIVKFDSTAQTSLQAEELELPHEMKLQLQKGFEPKLDSNVSCIDMAKSFLTYPVSCKLYNAFETAIMKEEGRSPPELSEISDAVVLNETTGKLGSGYLTTTNGSECHSGAISRDTGSAFCNVKSRKSLCLSTDSLLTTGKKSETSHQVMHHSALDVGVLGIMGLGSKCYLKSMRHSKEVIEEHSTGSASTIESNSNKRPDSHLEPAKAVRKRSRPYRSCRPQIRDRQLIQNRVKELRDLVPNGSKCSVNSLLEQAVDHILFLQHVTKQESKKENSASSKMREDVSSFHDHDVAEALGPSYHRSCKTIA